MKRRARVIAACAILVAFGAGTSHAAPSSEAKTAATLTSFGSPLSASDVAALAIHAPGAAAESRLQPSSFASSLPLTTSLALDSGAHIDTAGRFASFDAAQSPLRDEGSFLGLADGGRYAGLTYVAGPDISARLGASNWTGRFDNDAMNGDVIGLPALYDGAHVNSVLAGVTWNVNEWVGIGFNAIAAFQTGTPLDYQAAAPLTRSAATQALQISARFNLNQNWFIAAELGQGRSQLRRQGASAVSSLDAQTFALAVVGRGLFGDDAVVGFGVSRPALGSVGGFGSLASSTTDLPAVMVAAGRAPETDFQLGYITSFLGGKLALQTNAAYQVNPQGQTGASAVSVLSRAKIKF
jgi:hypothetical protein